MGEIKRMFTPEFRNRLDATISFASLDHEVILRVVDKFLLELENQLHEKKVEPSFTPELKEFLAKKGFDPQMGARPMARLIQDTIRKALADELLFGKLVERRPGDDRPRRRREGEAGVRGSAEPRPSRSRKSVERSLDDENGARGRRFRLRGVRPTSRSMSAQMFFAHDERVARLRASFIAGDRPPEPGHRERASSCRVSY